VFINLLLYSCFARAIAGQLYATPTMLSVRFINDCQHQEDSTSYGRLEGSWRVHVGKLCQGNRRGPSVWQTAAAAWKRTLFCMAMEQQWHALQSKQSSCHFLSVLHPGQFEQLRCMPLHAGRNTRDVHDALLTERPTEHKLDGNLSKSGASCAVLRKAKNEIARVSVKAAQGIEDPFAAASALSVQMMREDQQAMQSNPNKERVICYGFLHCLHRGLNGQYVIGGWLDWQVATYAQLCKLGLLGGLWLDASGGEVRGCGACAVHVSGCYIGCYIGPRDMPQAWCVGQSHKHCRYRLAKCSGVFGF